MIDHRVRVAAERRERMRARLIEAAFSVFGKHNAEPAVIDQVIRLAGVSRGSFYNYFDSSEDLLKAVAIQVGNELMQAVAPVVEAREDPVERMSAGIRSWMVLVRAHPQLAAFFRRAGLYVLEQDTQVRVDLPRDLIAGMQSGQFTVGELELGFVLVAGTVLAAINTLALGEAPADYGNKLAQRVLMALGVDSSQAQRIAMLPLPDAELPETSIIVRASAERR
ncbi:MAG TPA: TetR/AcrR family transcriptional regulator [Sphingomicrobium sp.]|nr:TetR/AcrR family transcriptional regulator [Sphingomicrobium sp.]